MDKTFVIDNSSTLTSAWMELFVFILEVTECNGVETFLGRSSWCLNVRVKLSLDINGGGCTNGKAPGQMVFTVECVCILERTQADVSSV